MEPMETGNTKRLKGLFHMIRIKKKSELLGAEKYGQCASCAKGSSETEL